MWAQRRDPLAEDRHRIPAFGDRQICLDPLFFASMIHLGPKRMPDVPLWYFCLLGHHRRHCPAAGQTTPPFRHRHHRRHRHRDDLFGQRQLGLADQHGRSRCGPAAWSWIFLLPTPWPVSRSGWTHSAISGATAGRAQSLIAIGSGGFLGLGLGQGRLRNICSCRSRPATSSFRWSVKELGMVGAVLIMIVFAALIIRGFQIALPVGRTASARCWWPASPPDRAVQTISIWASSPGCCHHRCGLPFSAMAAHPVDAAGRSGIILGVSGYIRHRSRMTDSKGRRDDRTMKILFTGGGTAGHVNPAIAVAGYIKSQQPQADIRFAGAEGARRAVGQAGGLPIAYIPLAGLSRKLNWKGIRQNVDALSKAAKASRRARRSWANFNTTWCWARGNGSSRNFRFNTSLDFWILFTYH